MNENFSSHFQGPAGALVAQGRSVLVGALGKHFSGFEFPKSEEGFKIEFQRQFERFTGMKVDSMERVRVEAFSQGGMSSGMVDAEFWEKTALPLLLERLKQARFG